MCACCCGCAMPVLAQQPPDIFAGPRDVLYVQSGLPQSMDKDWFGPDSMAHDSTDSPRVDFSSPGVLSATINDEKPAKDSSSADVRLNAQDKNSGGSSTGRFRWAPAIGESLLYTGIMHTFDLASQPGTRDSLNGHWFRNYMQSLAALRGWSD